MELKSVWHRVASFWKTRVPDWRTLRNKCLPYGLVVIFAAATVLGVLGAQGTKLEYTAYYNTKAKLEAEKQQLEADSAALQLTLEQTQTLLSQLSTMKTDASTLLTALEQQGIDAGDTLANLRASIENFENQQEQRWVLPMQFRACTSPYGNRDHPINEEAHFHNGVDLGDAEGTPIVASRSGTVTKAAYEPDTSGYYVIVDHLDGYDSRYLHMSKYIVTEGQFVWAGQIIGYCGSSGSATGSHLHFSIFKDGKAVNPNDYIDLY